MAPPAAPTVFDQFARGWRGYLLIALIALCSGLMGAAENPCDRYRRSPLRPSYPPDDRNGRLRSHSHSGRRAQSKTRWHQLAAGRFGEGDAAVRRWPQHALALSTSLGAWAGACEFGDTVGRFNAAWQQGRFHRSSALLGRLARRRRRDARENRRGHDRLHSARTRCSGSAAHGNEAAARRRNGILGRCGCGA